MRKLALLFLLAAALACAQQDRITDHLDSRSLTPLDGHARLEAQPRFDQGRLGGRERISGISLMFRTSVTQQAELEKLLEDLRDPASPDYHNWLTPQQYADRFGLSRSDMVRVTSWLTAQGLSVDYVAESRNWILFSGSTAEVENAFAVEIHNYLIDGELHYANRTTPSVPKALEPVVQTITGLDDFRLRPQLRRANAISVQPEYTATNGTHYLGPGDLSVIYNTKPLLDQKITGAGQKLVVVGQSNVDPVDDQYYRTQLFKLAINDPQMILVKGSADPGITADQDEADLDLQVAGGMAPDATILYVYSTNVMTSVQYAIAQNYAPVITMSYGGCEEKMTAGSASNANSLRSIAQQAVAQGITWLASTGDQGAAGCDYGNKIASQGLAVQIPASIPEVTAVGGSEFVEGTGAYWNSSTPNSALSYIPEKVWNDTADGGGLSSGTGGVSIFYPKPAWQTGPGVPNDNARDLPDVAFAAANDHDPYYIVVGGKVIGYGGTSAATPAFAGMLTLVNQYLVSTGALSKPGLGNINPNLYSLWQNTPGIFHDIQMGNNIVPCTAGSPNCVNGTLGYSAGPGYDLASGMGSIDIYNLAQSWNAKPLTGTTTTLSANPATFPVTGSTVLTATVQAAAGSTTPVGSISFTAGGNPLGTANLSGSGATATANLTVAGNQLATGANTVKASYSGATAFSGSSGSTTVTVTVPTTNSAVVASANPNPAYQQQPDAAGNRWFVTARLTEIAGVATTLTSFSIAGKDMSAAIPSLFGSANIAAHGTLSASLGVNVATVPSTVSLAFGGKDASGTQWNQQVSVQLYGPQLSASLGLSSAPNTEMLNPKGDPNCGTGIYQELNLQELNGHEVILSKFLAAGNDLTAHTSEWFGSWRIAPLGTLQARLCWELGAPDLPATYDYEIDGVDDQGNTVKTTLSVSFLSPAQSQGALSASKTDFPLTVLPGKSTSGSIAVTVPAGQPWTVAKFPANQTTGWLTVSPQSGTGPGTVNFTVSGASLPIGAYQAILVLQSVNTVPQFINITVSLLVASASPLTITGVANGASFQQNFAPGMVLSVFGTHLSNSSSPLFAASVPLPLSLGGVSATINGIPAPLYYVSPTQLNIQVPYETGSGYALLTVNNNGQALAYYFLVSPAAPGIFVGANSSLIPVSTARRGDVVTLFMTGEGDVTPAIATGSSPTASSPIDQLPAPRIKPFTVKVAGEAVTPQFVGIPSGLVGETQINFAIPADAPLGPQPVVVTVGTATSLAATVTITQ